MELSPVLLGAIVATVIMALAVIYYGWRLKVKRQARAKTKPKALPYAEARELARTMLQERYQGQRGFVKPYAREFHFKHSPETLRKVLQKTNPIPNKYYVQTVLNDLAPGKYEVLQPNVAGGKQEVA